MHFEILIEDQSGKKALEYIVPKIIGDKHTYTVHYYKGIGRIPKNLRTTADPSHRILLDQLPKLLKGYGHTFEGYGTEYQAVVILVCDLDDKCLHVFRQELLNILDTCDPKPKTQFCIAIEEGESWFLGDISAIKLTYPRAKDCVLEAYVNDSICGTWERLADAVYPGGAKKLSDQGWQAIGAEKSVWAENISPNLDVNRNCSPSFCYFRDKLRELMT